jgi:hypothetical protein
MKTTYNYHLALEVPNSKVVSTILAVRRALKREMAGASGKLFSVNLNDISFETAQLDSSCSVIFWFTKYSDEAQPRRCYLFALPEGSSSPTKFTDIDDNEIRVGDRVFYTGTSYGNSRASLNVGTIVRFTKKNVVVKNVKTDREITREFRFVVKAPHKQQYK